MFILAALLVCVFGQVDPVCSPFTVKDPNSPATYTYDLSGFRVPDGGPKNSLLEAKEAGSKWNTFMNVCGDSSLIVGCLNSTPACQADGAGGFYSLGTPGSWTFHPFYAPNNPNKRVVPDGGVIATISGGDSLLCPNGARRNATMFFKCNPQATTRPSKPIPLYEYDPGDPNKTLTPCVYYFGVVEHASFCPSGGSSNGPEIVGAPVNEIRLCVNLSGDFSVITSTPEPFISQKLNCTNYKGCEDSSIFSCFGNVNNFCSTVNVTALTLKTGDDAFTFRTTPGASAPCAKTQGFFSTTSSALYWQAQGDGMFVAVDNEATTYMSIKESGAFSCFTCDNNDRLGVFQSVPPRLPRKIK